MTRYDAIIIGFGKGGKTLALELAKRGEKVALVELSSQMYGGTCINVGCIPTKTLVHLAKHTPNSSFEVKRNYYAKAIVEKNSIVAQLRAKNFNNLDSHPNITIYNGFGSFLGHTAVNVATADGNVAIQATQIFINTGSTSIMPNIDGAKDNDKVYNSTSIMNLKTLPERLTIIGGGYIGLEFASIYASFGSKVTVLEYGDKFIAREDRDIAELVKNSLESKGVKIILNAKVERINNGDTYYNDDDMIAGDAILIATGRKANTYGLNLEVAGVVIDKYGAIKVDNKLVTTNPLIRAIGDVKGGLQFTYISLDDYRIIIDDLYGTSLRTLDDRNPVSYSVFIDPPLSRVGLSEDDAIKQEIPYIVKTLSVAAIPRAKTIGESTGMLKAIIHKETEQILGATLFCPESSEMINIIALAIKTNAPASILRNFIYTHPSMTEALNDLF